MHFLHFFAEKFAKHNLFIVSLQWISGLPRVIVGSTAFASRSHPAYPSTLNNQPSTVTLTPMLAELIIPIASLRGKLSNDGFYFRLYRGKQIVQRTPAKWRDTPARRAARERFIATYARKKSPVVPDPSSASSAPAHVPLDAPSSSPAEPSVLCSTLPTPS